MSDTPSDASRESDNRHRLEAMRRELIAEFDARQAVIREYLSFNEVAAFMAVERGESSPAAALAELMGHASVGAFDGDTPALLLLRENVGVELQWIKPDRDAFDGEGELPPAAQLDSEGLKLLRGLPDGDATVASQIMPHCWARRETVVALLRKLGVDRVAMPTTWRQDAPAEDPPTRTFTPYPAMDESSLSPKVRVAREVMRLLWSVGSPDWLSAQAMADQATAKYKTLGRNVLARGKPISKITEDDIKRALGRK